MADRLVDDFRSSDERERAGEPVSSRESNPFDAPTLHQEMGGWIGDRWRRSPWWAKVLAVFLASRVVTTIILLAFANIQKVNPWTGAKPDYFSFAAMWDSYWYYLVAVTGYPSHLPVGADGLVTQNTWAFLPGFPLVLRGFVLAGIPYQVAGVIIAVGFSLGATLLFFRLMRRVLPEGTALFAVVLFCTGATSTILQVGYAESMFLFFLFWALLLFQHRRYYLMIPVMGLAALTRPGALAFAAMLLFHLVYRFLRREKDAFPLREGVAVIVSGLAAAFFGVAWNLVAWIATGSSTAYTDTELSWRVGWIGVQPFVLFQSWFVGAHWWLGTWLGLPNAWLLAIATMVVLIAGFAALLIFHPAVRVLGTELRFWLAGYAVYLLAVFFPQSSTFRLLMPFAPVLGAVALPSSRVYRVALVLLGIASQVGWIAIAWWVNGSDWSPP